MKTFFFALLYCFFSTTVYCQKFRFIDVPSNLFPEKQTTSIDYVKNGISFTDITNYLPDNYVTNGSVDYTEFLQKALDSNSYILMPNFPILVSDVGLSLKSNSIVFFQKGSLLQLKASDKKSYQVLRLHNLENVQILNANIIGDRYSHLDDKGEWGMGIELKGSENVKIINANIKDCWGDGIYIGHKVKPSRNVYIGNSNIDNNRRNGISVISVDILEIQSTIISNTNGASPCSGLDIEPNSSLNSIDNIKINNLVTFNNQKNGVLIHLREILSNRKKKVNITFLNLIDVKSSRAIRISGSTESNVSGLAPMIGQIRIKGYNFSKNKFAPVFNSNSLFPKIILDE